MKKFLELLNQYKEEGKLYSQVHPSLPLTIWNYTPKVQYEGLWNDVTLMCRGLVTDNAGKIVARPFKKFFNIEENRHEPTKDFEVFEKLDGSLIIVFWYENQWLIASRGSFTSDHVKWADKILSKAKRNKFLIPCHTYCFELIHPENRIVVNYGERKELVATAIFDCHGKEIPLEIHKNAIPVVKKYEGLDWKNIKDLNWKNSEGFVVRFSNGSRCKIKFEDYIRLHRVMTNISEKKIWEALKDGKPISSILENVPDEFFDQVKEIEGKFLQNFYDLGDTYRSIFRKISLELGPDPNRKEFAKLANQHTTSAILFSMLSGRDYSDKIWKILEPKSK
jgi:RNA ligase